MLKEMKIGFIGGGNMAEALIKGLIQGGIPSGNIWVAEPVAKQREYLAGRYQVSVEEDNRVVARGCSLLLIAVKPQMAVSALADIAECVTGDTLLVSIMAGVSSSTIEGAFMPLAVRVVRVMPNTPSLVLQGAAAIAAGTHLLPGDMDLAGEIFSLVGKCWQVDEKMMDAVTGLSGSGPAYVMTFVEALSDAGVKNGLPRDIAYGLALQTILGTASLLAETCEHPALLREKVTSPGGTTIAGVQALEVGGFRGTVMSAVNAATSRSAELGRKQ